MRIAGHVASLGLAGLTAALVLAAAPGAQAAQSADFKRGMAASLALPGQAGTTYPAKVVDTSDAINPSTRTLLVQLQADNAGNGLLAGSYADVRFDLTNAGNALRVPISTLIFRRKGLEVATLGADHRVVMKPITLGRDFGTEVEVVSGLDASDRVIDSPPDSLGAGDQVEISAPSAKGANA